MVYVTGDTHGEHGRFMYNDSEVDRTLSATDYLIICGDFGYIFSDDEEEHDFLDFLATKKYSILFVDGNHDNFDALEKMNVEEWCEGKVHVIRRDEDGNPKVIHLMRGQVFVIEGKKYFTFGGGYSFDQGKYDLSGKPIRIPHESWWEQEMPSDQEMKDGVENLARFNNSVDYIITHAAPERINYLFHKWNRENPEAPLNNYLQWVYDNVTFKHWYFGHHHQDDDVRDDVTVLFFEVRDVETNTCLSREEECEYRLILNSKGLNTISGRKQIKKALEGEWLDDKSIFAIIPSEYEKEEVLKEACLELGFRDNHIFFSKDFEGMSFHQITGTDYVYVSEGNTFFILDYMRQINADGSQNEFVQYVQRLMWDEGATYIGSSAGALIATETIEPAGILGDSNFVRMNRFGAIGLIKGTIIPHYTKEQYDEYYESLSEYDIKRYKRIQYVSNDEVLIYHMVLQDGEQKELDSSRIELKD